MSQRYFDGISQDKPQLVSLYRQNGDYSGLDEGVVNARAALIPLLLETQSSAS